MHMQPMRNYIFIALGLDFDLVEVSKLPRLKVALNSFHFP